MASERRDLYGECNVDGASLDQFTAECCSRCMTSECSRSLLSGVKFERRIQSWEDRLFNNPPQMDPQDPRYMKIQGQRFLTLYVGRTPEIRSSGWIDPLAEAEKLETAPVSPASIISVPPVPSSKLVLPRRLSLANAPDQSGKMVGAPVTPSRDPWAASSLPPTTDPTISPGGTVKLRGSGV
jgi:hypothetical protein